MASLLDRKRTSRDLKSWLDDFSRYNKRFESWESRVEKITQRYVEKPQDNLTSGAGKSRFNILWSNVQTLKAATFSRLPKPDVSRRFKDQDPVGRVASLILERALDYEVNHYPDYRATLDGGVLDRFIGGRGTAWVRYEPHMRAKDDLVDGAQVTEDVDEGQEELDYECAPTDYVHWEDFGHSVARTWEEVTRVWRRVYMKREALVARFGEEIGKAIPLDAAPDEMKKAGLETSTVTDTACIYEGWDKEKKEAVWINKSIKDFLDVRPDPLGLEEFFPCPKPLYGTLSNDSLVPTPDYVLYQDQARELDTLCDRIDGLVKALKVMGCYDAANPVLARIFTEGQNTALFPVKNWAAFAEKQGLKGSIDLVDLKMIYGALEASYMAMAQIKQQVYEITGISDIIRGNTDAGETATAQQLKGQYASLRLKDYQNGVAMYSTGLLQLKAQVICNKFHPETIAKIAGVNELSETDKQLVPQAMQLLLGERATNPESESPNPLRAFRIEVASDSMVYLDEQAEKEARVEFLTATGTFLEKTVAATVQMGPEVKAIMVPLFMEMLKFGVQGFRIGKSIEGAFDNAASKLSEMAAQPPQQPPPDPKMIEEQVRGQLEQEYAQKDAVKEVEHNKRAADLDIREMKFNAEKQIAAKEFEFKGKEIDFAKREVGYVVKDADAKASHQAERAKFDEEKAKAAKESADDAGGKVAQATQAIDGLLNAVQALEQNVVAIAERVEGLTKREVVKMERVRGKDGRLSGVRRQHADGTMSEVSVQ